MHTVFWITFALLFYLYAGYPLFLWMLARWFGRPVRKGTTGQKCSVVISAYNEARTLPGKLRTLLSGRNGDCVEEVLIGSDGSDDGTEQAVERVGDDRIRVVRFDRRRGKPSVLNDLVPQCRADVVVLTDARQELSDRALVSLLANFSDEQVGVVSGELIFRRSDNGSSTAEGMDAYWRYEKFIRRAEGRFRSVPGATGALYAIRRDLFTPMHPEILLDDVAVPMQAILKGHRCVFEEAAIVYDVPSQTGKAEGIRKRRTIAGNIQLAACYPAFLNPWRNPIWFEFVSHKMLRLVSPFLLMVLLAANGGIVGRQYSVSSVQCSVFHSPSLLLNTEHCLLNTAYWISLVAQALFYLLAAIGLRPGLRSILTAVPAMFLRLNIITMLAWADALLRRYRVDWRRIPGEGNPC